MTMTTPVFLLGHYMRLAMESAGLEVGDMAERMGVSRGTVSRWLNNRGMPRRGELLAWAQLTDVPAEWLENAPVARPEGLEPPTFWLVADGERSIAEYLAWHGVLAQLTAGNTAGRCE